MGPYVLLQSGLCPQHFKFTYIFAHVPGSGWYSILLASDAFPVFSVLFTNGHFNSSQLEAAIIN